MALIALELEPDRIHVASARSASKRTQIQHLFSVEVTGSDEEVAATLRDELSKHGLGRSDAIVVVNRCNCEIRLLDVPPAPDGELPDIVRFIARNEFASLNDNWLLDYVRLTGDQSSTGQVLAAGVSPEMNNQIKAIVESSGLKLKHIVLRPFATVGVVGDRLDGDSIRMLIDPNDDQTDLSIVDGSTLVATRTVRIPIGNGDHGEKLIPEIKRTIASSSRALGGKPVSQFLVFGGPEYSETMGEKLRSRFDVDVAFVDPLKLPMVGTKVAASEHGTRYVSLMGALAQQASGQRHPIDFLNPRKPAAKASSRNKWLAYGGLAAAVALLAFGACWWVLDQQTKRIATLGQELEQLEDRNNGEIGGVSVDQKLSEVGKVDEWVLNRVDWQQELLEFSNLALTADDTIVDSMTASAPSRRTPGQIAVTMRSTDFRTEGELIESLESRYDVTPTRSNDVEEDKDYPIQSTLKIPLAEVNAGLLEQIDEKADAFFKKMVAKRKAANQAGKPEATEDEEAAVGTVSQDAAGTAENEAEANDAKVTTDAK